MTSIYTRNKNASGAWRYKRVNVRKGHRTELLSPPFYVRPFLSGKQVWTRLAAQTFDAAKQEVAKLQAEVQSQAADRATNRVPLARAINTYLEQKSGKARKTVAQYRLTFTEFLESLGGKVRFLDEITEDVLRRYKRFMVDQGYAGKTIDTRLNIVFFLLKKNGIAARIPRDEMPVVEEEPAVPYTEAELNRLFAAMTEEETIRYKFFLGTGCRDKEVTYAAWSDIDFDQKTYHVRRKEDVHFTPKSHESRTIPLPDSLVVLLKARRKNAPHDRWIFVNAEGRPDNHFLRKLKSIAKRAGLNCGQCRTTITEGKYDKKRRIEVSCKDRPVCQHFYLHRFRKTCASRWEQHGVPIRTIQHYLGHKNLETTMIYLGVADSSKLRGNINAAFGD